MMSKSSKAPSTQQMSTVVSDAVLASVCFYFATLTFSHNPLGASAIFMLGSAASAGVARFYGINQAIKPHSVLVFAFTTCGMLLLASGFLVAPNGTPDFNTVAAVCGGVSAVAFALVKFKPRLEEVITLLFGFVFIGASLYKCILGQVWGGVAGTLIFTASGLFGVSGTFKGFKKVDIFHYLLAVAVFLLCQALTQVW